MIIMEYCRFYGGNKYCIGFSGFHYKFLGATFPLCIIQRLIEVRI